MPPQAPADIRDELTLELAQIRDELTTAYGQYGRARTEDERQYERISFMTTYKSYVTTSDALMPLLLLAEKADLRVQNRRVEAERLGIAPTPAPKQAAAPKVRINPPKFAGEDLKYHGWRETWNTYHNNPIYTASEKSQMLEAALEGEAARATASFTFSAESYETILQVLADRFGNPSQVIGKREAMLRQAASKHMGENPTAAQLREKHIEVCNQRRGLLNQGVQPATFDSHTASEIMRSIPSTITERWRLIWGPNHSPTLDQVLYQLDMLIQIKSMEEAARRIDYASSTQNNIANITTTTGVRFRDKTPPRLACVICKGEAHDSFACTMGTPADRRKVMLDADRCFRCLGQGHRYYDCRENLTCRNCLSTSHATVLCPHERLGRSKNRGTLTARTGSKSPNGPRAALPMMRTKSPSMSRTPSPGGRVNEQANVSKTQCYGQITAGVLLNFGAKAKVEKTEPGPDEWVQVYGIFDNGCGNSFITTDLARRLNAKVVGQQLIRVSTFGSTTPIDDHFNIVKVTIAGTSKQVTDKFIVKDFIQTLSPYTDTELGQKLLREGKTLADPRHKTPSYASKVDILIGNSSMGDFLSMEAPRKHKKVLAQNSIFGWAISGSLDDPENNTTAFTTRVEIVPEEEEISSVDKHFAVFWGLESLGIPKNEKTDAEFIQAYIDSIETDEERRAVIRLPFREERSDYDSCRSIAKKRLESLLECKTFTYEQREQYHAVIRSYLDDGFIEEADLDYEGQTAYLPNRPVIRQNAETTKIRPVFDGSVHHKNRRSFNANLEPGPNLNPDIMGILMRFRRYLIAWTADIEKAFLQIKIHEDHGQIVRFLWVDDPNSNNPIDGNDCSSDLPVVRSSSEPCSHGTCKNTKPNTQALQPGPSVKSMSTTGWGEPKLHFKPPKTYGLSIGSLERSR